jgi:hypothetical protein
MGPVADFKYIYGQLFGNRSSGDLLAFESSIVT